MPSPKRFLVVVAALVILAGVAPLWADDAPPSVDTLQRRLALQALDAAVPALVSALVPSILANYQIEAQGSVSADLAINCPYVAGHIKTNLVAAIRSDPGLACDVLTWLRNNLPAEFAVPAQVTDITTDLLSRLAQATPQKLDQFLLWLAQRSPGTLGKVGQSVVRSAGDAVLDLALYVARTYPRQTARAVGYVTLHYPRMLPYVMRLLARKPA
jgi:hypothetical protein